MTFAIRCGGLIAAALLASAASATSYTYATIDAPAPNLLGTVVTGINDAGHAAGYYVTAGDVSLGEAPQNYHAFTVNADGSGFTNIDRAGYWQTGAAGINNAGSIVGVSVSYTGVGTGFLRATDGSFTDIDPATLGSVYSEAVGISNTGAIVGYFTQAVPPSLDQIQLYSHGYLYDAGVYSQIDIPENIGFGTQLNSINSAGLITGSFLDYSYLPHAFLYNSADASFTFFSALQGAPMFTQIGAINDAGAYPLGIATPDPTSPVGFRTTSYIIPGGTSPLAAPGADSTSPFAVNLPGQVTGFYTEGLAIHGFIATPAPEPATWAMMLAGFSAIGFGLRRRRVAQVTA